MPNYDYECIKCETVYGVEHSIKDDAFKKHLCPKCDKKTPCKRLISMNYSGIIFKGDGWTIPESGHGNRGYKGIFQNLIRKKGSPVEAPDNKREADMQFNQWVDSGGLAGIKPNIEINAQDFANRPKTTEEIIDKGKNKL